jgi:uncharacterized protein (TIGR01319 family)
MAQPESEPPGLDSGKGCAEKALLIDIGSTYTKLVGADLKRGRIIGQAEAVSTVETDVTIGLEKALSSLEKSLGQDPRHFPLRLACSSAAGGLRMVALGLVPELTMEAARRAALGAGAKILSSYSHKLTPVELKEIVESSPDMILLAGGTDGGDTRVILHNAQALAKARITAPIVVAGNKEVAEQVEALLRQGGKEARVTANVMPKLGELNVEPARQAIRQLFIEHIVEAKGLKKAEKFVTGVVMPTPAAVLKAAKLLADGTDEEPGLGELIVVDVGGATTDVHSVARGEPSQETALLRGLPEPYAKRTVEGDLGLRVSAPSLLEAVGRRQLLDYIGIEDLAIEEVTQRLRANIGFVAHTPRDQAIDLGMSKAAVKLGVERHVGTLQEFYLPAGYYFIQRGKDLTEIGTLIGTGGPFRYLQRPREILREALFDEHDPLLLRPKHPKLYIDKRYIMWAMGLLADIAPDVALRMMKENLEEV